jgi:hypothetical protein
MGDCLGHYRKHLSGQTAIAFCCSVAHAEAVAALFQSAGIAAASIDGSMDTGTRRELLQRLAVGDLKVLTSCALIGEGVDVPSLAAASCCGLRPAWAPPADDRSMPAPATRQDCGGAGSCRQYAPAWPPPRRARLDARRAPQTRPRGSAIGQGMPYMLRHVSLAPRRYAATAGMYLHHQSAGSCDRLRVSCRRSR